MFDKLHGFVPLYAEPLDRKTAENPVEDHLGADHRGEEVDDDTQAQGDGSAKTTTRVMRPRMLLGMV
jgi:hypothetical protein